MKHSRRELPLHLQRGLSYQPQSHIRGIGRRKRKTAHIIQQHTTEVVYRQYFILGRNEGGSGVGPGRTLAADALSLPDENGQIRPEELRPGDLAHMVSAGSDFWFV